MNHKNSIIVLCVSVVFVLGVFVPKNSSQARRITKTIPQKTSDLKIVYSGKGEYRCEVTDTSQGSKSSIVFVKGKMARFDYKIGLYQAHLLIKNNFSYTWVEHALEVQKKEIKPNENIFNQATVAGKKSSVPGTGSDLQYKCQRSTIPNSTFDIPTNASLNLPVRPSQGDYDQVADQLLASNWVPFNDSAKKYSFDFPTGVVVSSSTTGHVFDHDMYDSSAYHLFGKFTVDDSGEFHFTVDDMSKQYRQKIEKAPWDNGPDTFRTIATTVASEYKRSIDIEQSIPQIQVLKDEVIKEGGIKNIRVHVVVNNSDNHKDYTAQYFFENNNHIFNVSVSGPSERVGSIADKFIRSFKH